MSTVKPGRKFKKLLDTTVVFALPAFHLKWCFNSVVIGTTILFFHLHEILRLYITHFHTFNLTE